MNCQVGVKAALCSADISLLSHFLPPLLKDPEVLPGRMGYVIPLLCCPKVSSRVDVPGIHSSSTWETFLSDGSLQVWRSTVVLRLSQQIIRVSPTSCFSQCDLLFHTCFVPTDASWPDQHSLPLLKTPKIRPCFYF